MSPPHPPPCPLLFLQLLSVPSLCARSSLEAERALPCPVHLAVRPGPLTRRSQRPAPGPCAVLPCAGRGSTLSVPHPEHTAEGFPGEQGPRSESGLPEPHLLLQPTCAWTPCWWPRTGPFSSAHPLPMVRTRGHPQELCPSTDPQGWGKTQNLVLSLLGTCDTFFLAPEVAERELVTEKVTGTFPSLPAASCPIPLVVPPSAQRAWGWGVRHGPRTGTQRVSGSLPQCRSHLPNPGLGRTHLAGVFLGWLEWGFCKDRSRQ